MAEYRIEILPAAHRELDALHPLMGRRISRSIDNLSFDPRPRGVRKVRREENSYRLRVGDYRVLYDVYDNEKLVSVYSIRHRREAYR